MTEAGKFGIILVREQKVDAALTVAIKVEVFEWFLWTRQGLVNHIATAEHEIHKPEQSISRRHNSLQYNSKICISAITGYEFAI